MVARLIWIFKIGWYNYCIEMSVDLGLCKHILKKMQKVVKRHNCFNKLLLITIGVFSQKYNLLLLK